MIRNQEFIIFRRDPSVRVSESERVESQKK